MYSPYSSVVERATRNGEVGCSIQPGGMMKRSFSCLFRNLEKEVILLMGPGQYSTESGRPIRTSSMHFESLCDNGRRARSRVTSKGAFLSPTLSMIDVSVRLHYSAMTSQADSVERGANT